jgi:hypothetical protein
VVLRIIKYSLQVLYEVGPTSFTIIRYTSSVLSCRFSFSTYIDFAMHNKNYTPRKAKRTNNLGWREYLLYNFDLGGLWSQRPKIFLLFKKDITLIYH